MCRSLAVVRLVLVVHSSVAILVFFKPNLVYFAIVCFFSIWFIVYFFIFWFVFSFSKMFYARCHLGQWFPNLFEPLPKSR